MVGDTPQVMRVENKTPPNLRVDPIAPQIHGPLKKQFHTNYNYATVNFTGISTNVAPPVHLQQKRSRFIEADNKIATVSLDEIFYPRELQMNSVIHLETPFA